MKTDLETRTIWMYGTIGSNDDINAKTVIDHLAELGAGDIRIRINSEGGEVSEGWAVRTAISRHDGVIECVNDSCCASMATVIYLAGDVRLATPYCSFMVHSPYSCTTGSRHELRKAADTLDHFERTMRTAYLEKLNCTESDLESMLESETWLDANEAIELGLATGYEQASADVEMAVMGSDCYKPSVEFLADQKTKRVWAKIRARQSKSQADGIKRAGQAYRDGILASLKQRGINVSPGFPGLQNRMVNQPPPIQRTGDARCRAFLKDREESHLARRHAFMAEYGNKPTTLEKLSTQIADWKRERKLERIKAEIKLQQLEQEQETAKIATRIRQLEQSKSNGWR